MGQRASDLSVLTESQIFKIVPIRHCRRGGKKTLVYTVLLDGHYCMAPAPEILASATSHKKKVHDKKPVQLCLSETKDFKCCLPIV